MFEDRIRLASLRDRVMSADDAAKLIGDGMVQCLTDWSVKQPQILVMRGASTDNNATLFAQGYMGVLQPDFASGKYVDVAEPAGTWDPATARTTFEQQYTAHNNINAVVVPNDDNANAVISYLKTLNVPPRTFPTTGQDATLTGLQNVLAGYQCGTVYKAIYLEAQAAAALAIYLASGTEPPAGLVNGKTPDSTGKTDVASVLLTPIWVTAANMNQTVVTDGFVDKAKLCAADLAEQLLPVFLVRMRLLRRPGVLERGTYGIQAVAHRTRLFDLAGEGKVRVLAHPRVVPGLDEIGRRGAEIELPAEFDDVVQPFFLGSGTDQDPVAGKAGQILVHRAGHAVLDGDDILDVG